MGILISLFFGLIFIVLLVILFVLGFIRSIFRFGKPKNNSSYQQPYAEQPTSSTRSKVFSKEEGEYADYEEIK